MKKLTPGFLAVALQLQEAGALFQSDVRTRLQGAIQDLGEEGSWNYYLDHDGDGSSGNVIYSSGGDIFRAPYSCSDVGGKATTTINGASAVAVVPKITYQKDASEAAKESAVPDSLRLFESAATVEQIVLKEAKSDYEIKLIAPGAGSSAFYPAEVLKRDGPKVFTAGTHVYMNHPTAAEEAARPEGDVKNLAGVLTGAAVYHESHAKGPGLYGRMKVFADHAQTVEEKAAHVGMSIRASGIREAGEKRDGLPILKALTRAESVDVVTRAGAGGMILSEAATAPPISQEVEMTKEEVQALIEADRAKRPELATIRDLQARALRGDGMVEATRILASITLPENAKQRVIDNVLRETIPVTTDGQIDAAKFGELVSAEAKREGAYVASFTGTGVKGMGIANQPVVESDPVKIAEARRVAESNTKALFESDVRMFEAQGMSNAAAIAAAKSMEVAA